MYLQVVQTSRQSLIDLVVALVSVPLLVVFGLMLESNMRGDWTRDGETRWYVLSLGIVLLFVSIMVCGYVTHRLGICIWAVAQEPGNPRHESNVSSVSVQGIRQRGARWGTCTSLGY
jgi:protein-S-isoprenylcysteine O-methyltransferase Ste14